MTTIDSIVNSISQGAKSLLQKTAETASKTAEFSETLIRTMTASPRRAFAIAGNYAAALPKERQHELAEQGYETLQARYGRNAGRELARMQSEHKGFTLVELLVVISIISLLASMLLPALRRAQDKAYEASTINTLKQIQLAITTYKDEYGKYYPPGNLIGPDQSYKVLPEQLKGYIDFPKELRHSSGGFKDGFGNVILYYEHLSYPAATETQEPPIQGSYNPTTYQLFSKGRDNRRGSTGQDPTNKDNPWVDVKHNNVVMFVTVREDKGI